LLPLLCIFVMISTVSNGFQSSGCGLSWNPA
jgi:hypothetical protein